MEEFLWKKQVVNLFFVFFSFLYWIVDWLRAYYFSVFSWRTSSWMALQWSASRRSSLGYKILIFHLVCDHFKHRNSVFYRPFLDFPTDPSVSAWGPTELSSEQLFNESLGGRCRSWWKECQRPESCHFVKFSKVFEFTTFGFKSPYYNTSWTTLGKWKWRYVRPYFKGEHWP